MKINWTHFNPIETYLREVHRIKKDTDYSVCIKYGECVVHCDSSYQRAIREAFNEYKVPVHIITFKWGSYKPVIDEMIASNYVDGIELRIKELTEKNQNLFNALMESKKRNDQLTAEGKKLLLRL